MKRSYLHHWKDALKCSFFDLFVLKYQKIFALVSLGYLIAYFYLENQLFYLNINYYGEEVRRKKCMKVEKIENFFIE